jgi:hypothetical protein
MRGDCAIQYCCKSKKKYTEQKAGGAISLPLRPLRHQHQDYATNGKTQIKSNIIYFNCACAILIFLNQNKQNGSYNTPLRELGRDQFSPLQVLLPIIRIKYTSLFGLVMLPQLCIDLRSSPNNVYSYNLSSQCFVYFQNVLFERREASRPSLHVFPIFPHIFYLMLQSSISQLVDWQSCDIRCYYTSICDPCGPKAP